MKNKEQFKQLKQLAKEAYNSKEVSQEWKDKILEACPDVKTKMEVGKWYRRGLELLVWNNGGLTYGFNSFGNYSTSYVFIDYTNAVLATEEEVKEALKKEARRRGFKEGVKIGKSMLSDDYNHNNILTSDELYFNELHDYGYIWIGNVLIYDNGKWAEIIQEPKEIEVEHEEVSPNILELNGKKYKLIPMN